MAVLKTGRALYCRLVSWVKFAVGTRTKTNWEVRKGLDSNPGTTQCRIPKIRRDKAVGGGVPGKLLAASSRSSCSASKPEGGVL